MTSVRSSDEVTVTLVEDGITGPAGEDATTLYIDSSRGTVFKNNAVSTVLSVIIYKGNKRITTSSEMKDEYGSSAYIQWYWQRIDEEEFHIISSTDRRLTDGGFRFTISPDDVDIKCVFKADLFI